LDSRDAKDGFEKVPAAMGSSVRAGDLRFGLLVLGSETVDGLGNGRGGGA